tara:strand:- start:908 stop:2215 length:1308 start_codon:yes stop_codon:yes gene_type:complete
MSAINGGDTDVFNILGNDQAKTMMKLKEAYKKSVKALLEKHNVEKLVVYIDDLDRLNPQIAVEVLEVLKLFLDVKNCVYVLAVDYDVVSSGIVKKYGDSFANDKGKSFFDKMIQLPFRMPVAMFDLDTLLKEQYQEFDVEDDMMLNFKRVIRKSIGTNPRTLKRVYNSFVLLNSIMMHENGSGSSKLSNREAELLFCIICMSHSYESLYDYLLSNSEWWKNTNDNIFNDAPIKIKEKLEKYDNDLTGDSLKLKRVNDFIEELRYVICGLSKDDAFEGDGVLSGLEELNQMLFYSQATSNQSVYESEESRIDLDPETIKEYRITHVRYNGAEYKPRGFKAAYVWLLNEMCKSQRNAEIFKEIMVNRPEGINERVFDIESAKKNDSVRSSIKEIENVGVKIVTHYSSGALCKQLLIFMNQFGVNENDIYLYGSMREG